MGTGERAQREEEALRHRTIEVVQRLALEEGWSSVTVRRVAEEIEWSPPKLYRLFGSKEGLVDVVKEHAHLLLLDRMQHARSTARDAHDGVLAVARAHAAFACDAPALFEVLYSLRAAPTGTGIKSEAAMACFGVLLETVASADPAVAGDAVALKRATHTFWAALYGVAALALHDQRPPDFDPVGLSEAVAGRLFGVRHGLDRTAAADQAAAGARTRG